MTAIVAVLAAAGFLFVFIGVIGILRLPDFYTRLHAMGKCDTLGVALVVAALMVAQGVTLVSLKLLLIVVFVWLANPTATHALGRAALKAGLAPWTAEDQT
jgi:multicomponent Na+:H+ antiporter subunit G